MIHTRRTQLTSAVLVGLLATSLLCPTLAAYAKTSGDSVRPVSPGDKASFHPVDTPRVARTVLFSFDNLETKPCEWGTHRHGEASCLVAWAADAERSEARKRAIAKIIGAFIAEAARRESLTKETDSLLLQILATLARDALVKSALHDVFPRAGDVQLGLMTRYATNVMEGKIGAKEFATQTARELLVKGIKQENPKFGAAAEFADFLYDLYEQRQAMQGRR